MSPNDPSIESDHESEKVSRGPGRPGTSREAVLLAADRVFAGSSVPARVTMDEVARAVGIGKGTLFRLFESRTGLLDALYEQRLPALLRDIESAQSALGSGAASAERAMAAMRAVTRFKLENGHLMRAREVDDTPLYDVPFYRTLHGLFVGLYVQAIPSVSKDAAWLAMHVLLGAARVDFLEEALNRRNVPLEDLLSSQDDLVRRLFTA